MAYEPLREVRVLFHPLNVFKPSRYCLSKKNYGSIGFARSVMDTGQIVIGIRMIGLQVDRISTMILALFNIVQMKINAPKISVGLKIVRVMRKNAKKARMQRFSPG